MVVVGSGHIAQHAYLIHVYLVVIPLPKSLTISHLGKPRCEPWPCILRSSQMRLPLPGFPKFDETAFQFSCATIRTSTTWHLETFSTTRPFWIWLERIWRSRSTASSFSTSTSDTAASTLGRIWSMGEGTMATIWHHHQGRKWFHGPNCNLVPSLMDQSQMHKTPHFPFWWQLWPLGQWPATTLAGHETKSATNRGWTCVWTPDLSPGKLWWLCHPLHFAFWWSNHPHHAPCSSSPTSYTTKWDPWTFWQSTSVHESRRSWDPLLCPAWGTQPARQWGLWVSQWGQFHHPRSMAKLQSRCRWWIIINGHATGTWSSTSSRCWYAGGCSTGWRGWGPSHRGWTPQSPWRWASWQWSWGWRSVHVPLSTGLWSPSCEVAFPQHWRRNQKIPSMGTTWPKELASSKSPTWRPCHYIHCGHHCTPARWHSHRVHPPIGLGRCSVLFQWPRHRNRSWSYSEAPPSFSHQASPFDLTWLAAFLWCPAGLPAHTMAQCWRSASWQLCPDDDSRGLSSDMDPTYDCKLQCTNTFRCPMPTTRSSKPWCTQHLHGAHGRGPRCNWTTTCPSCGPLHETYWWYVLAAATQGSTATSDPHSWCYDENLLWPCPLLEAAMLCFAAKPDFHTTLSGQLAWLDTGCLWEYSWLDFWATSCSSLFHRWNLKSEPKWMARRFRHCPCTPEGDRFGGFKRYSDADNTTAPRAELGAMLGAVTWASDLLAIWHQDHPIQVSFNFDSLLAGNCANGLWTLHCHPDIAGPLRALVHCLLQCHGPIFSWEHVRAHEGHPWNEAADAIAWACQYEWIPKQPLKDILDILSFDRTDFKTVEWLWFVEASLQQCPEVPITKDRQLHVNIAAPFHKDPDGSIHSLMRTTTQPTLNTQTFQMQLRCVTANVLTLYGLKQGGVEATYGSCISARHEALRKLCKEQKFHMIGIQESRSRLCGYVATPDFHVLSAPCTTRGVGGVQLWIAKEWQGTSGSIHIAADDLKIAHSGTQRMMVRLRHQDLKLVLLVGHAPNNVEPSVLHNWWDGCSSACPASLKTWPMIAFLDANARLGSFSWPFSTAAWKCFWGSLSSVACAAEHMILPQTYEHMHSGPGCTWTHASGATARLDFVAISQCLLHQFPVRTQIADIDLSISKPDHNAVLLEIDLDFVVNAPCESTPGPLLPWNFDWSTDVHTHAAYLQNYVYHHFHEDKPRLRPRRAHMTDSTWKLALAKKYHWRRQRDLVRTIKLGLLRALFSAWAHGTSSRDCKPWLRVAQALALRCMNISILLLHARLLRLL